MFFRTTAPSAQEFHVLVLSGGEVVSDKVFHCRDEASAFHRAEQLACDAGDRGLREVLAYVLDRDQAFLGSISAESRHLQSAA